MTIEAIKYVFDKVATKPDADVVRISLRGEPRDITIGRVNGTFQYEGTDMRRIVSYTK